MTDKDFMKQLVNLVFAEQMAIVSLFEAFAEQQPAIYQSGLQALRRVADAKPAEPGIQGELRRLIENIEARIALVQQPRH
jgi:hypothetical protein